MGKRSRAQLEQKGSSDKKSVFSKGIIRKILKSDQTLAEFQISGDAAHIIGKATEYFMNDLLIGSMANSKDKKLGYDDIAGYIDSEENLAFLSDICPKRVPYHTVSRFKQKEGNSN